MRTGVKKKKQAPKMSGDAAINLPAMTAEAERLTSALDRMKDPYGVQQLTKQIDSSADDEGSVKCPWITCC